MQSITILDGYVDEPTCLGVPPFISPYPRYIAGAIIDHNPKTTLQYFTIDQIRENNTLLHHINQTDLVIIIAGTSVPGRYLSGYPLHPQEAIQILQKLPHPIILLCGPAARYGFGTTGGKTPTAITIETNAFDGIITGDPEIVITDILNNQSDPNTIDLSKKRKNSKAISIYATKGATIVKQHPYFPHRLLTEIETYRGCPRSISRGCSFCTEALQGAPDFRSIEHITQEIQTLYNEGIRHFRLGNQPCLFTYKAKDATSKEIPKPNPEAIKQLFSEIRRIAPNLKTLHIDNVNPGVIARYPEESRQIIDSIITYHTSGDVAAFGVESLDPAVKKQNNLKADASEILQAITLFNETGKKRGNNGLPELLPGLNFIFGLPGESKKTYTINYQFLQEILAKNLLIRRINLRQVIPLPGTRLEKIGNRIMKKHQKLFKHFKYTVKHHIEQPLLKQLVPKKTVLTDVITELNKGNITFGRQLGSYPLLIGIPGKYPLYTTFNVMVIDHGFRSVTALPYPLNINTAPRTTIESIPGVGKKRATRILLNRPYNTKESFIQSLDDQQIAQQILPFLSFQQ